MPFVFIQVWEDSAVLFKYTFIVIAARQFFREAFLREGGVSSILASETTILAVKPIFLVALLASLQNMTGLYVGSITTILLLRQVIYPNYYATSHNRHPFMFLWFIFYHYIITSQGQSPFNYLRKSGNLFIIMMKYSRCQERTNLTCSLRVHLVVLEAYLWLRNAYIVWWYQSTKKKLES